MAINVKAVKRGYYGGRVYKAGDEFTVKAKGDIGSWMSPVTEEVKAPAQNAKGNTKKEEAKVTQSPQTDDLA